MKTIKQIADELKVSKQAVHQKRKKEPLSTALQPFTETVDGVVYISVDGEKLIKQAFIKSEPSTNHDMVDGVDDNVFTVVDGEEASDLSVVISALQKQLEVKDKQIEEKDKQIAKQQENISELTAVLADTASSLKAAQALHVGTMQKQLQSPLEVDQIEAEKPRGFLQRLFSKK